MKQSLHAPLAKVDGTKHTRNCNGERTETAKRSRTLSLHDEDDHELNKIEMPVRIGKPFIMLSLKSYMQFSCLQ
jgi:hypothetical protein